MWKSNYQLWLDYHAGKLNGKKLSDKELSEIRASEFAMHLLCPTEAILEAVGGYSRLHKIMKDFFRRDFMIVQLADRFQVQPEVMIIKVRDILSKGDPDKHSDNNKQDKKTNKKILKKEGNIIYLK